MKIVTFSMKHPVTIAMLTVASIIFGYVSLSRLPWNLLPSISYPTLTLRTEYADAAPAEVENLVTEPLEEAVAVVQGLKHLRSVSRAGVSEITLEFAWNTKMDYAALDVREKIDLVNLPDDVTAPVLLRYDPNLDPILRVGLYGHTDPVTLRYLAERVLKKDLESLEGVASARVKGGLEEEIQVSVDEGKLAVLGIPISAVNSFLASQNISASGGSLRDREAEFLVRTLNEFADADEIGQTVLAEHDGRKVRLADVSEIRRGYRERDVVTRVRGAEAVEIAVYKEGDANTVEVARQVKARLKRAEASLPAGTKTQVLFDQSTFIESAVDEVKANAIQGGFLAVLVLYLFLKDRKSTLVTATTIPISIIATFLVMQQLGVTLNIMSLGGLALGVGNMMDNAIVVLESIARHRAQGKGVWEATIDGTSEVAVPVTGSTATTVAVFLPIVFVEGIAGQIFRDQAITISASQIISLVVALTLIPVLSALGSLRRDELGGDAPTPPIEPRPAGRAARLEPLLRPAGIGFTWVGRFVSVLLPGALVRGGSFALRWLARGIDLVLWPLQQIFDRVWARFASYYPPILRASLARPWRTLGITGLLTAVAIALLPTLGTELVPQFSQGEFAFDLELPPGTPLQGTQTVAQAIEDELKSDPRIRVFFSSVGESPELGSARTQRRENVAQLSVAIQHPGDRAEEAAVIERIREVIAEHPGLRSTFRRPTYFSFQTPIEVLIYGHDLDELRKYSDTLTGAMGSMSGLRDLRSSLEEGSPEVRIEFDRDRVAAMGLDVEEIARTLRSKIRGDVATRLKERDRQLDIVVRNSDARTVDSDMVKNMVIASRDGIPVPLSSLATVTLGRGPSQITRDSQQRVAVIQADLVGRDLGSATAEVKRLLQRVPPPATLTASLGGQDEEISVSFRSLLLAGALAIFLVYMCMASEFESFLHPLVIMLAVPLGLVGVILSLAATHTAISVVVLIGVILLAGIVVNNAIVLIEYVNQLRKEGRAKNDALLEAGPVRLRPIFMTTITTVLGLVPMALGLGEGAEIRAPMAIGVIGGLSLATLLTLVVVPTVYSLVDRRP